MPVGLLGKKIGMTSIFSADGRSVACTVIEAGPCVVTQVRTKETDGYDAVQLGFGERKEKNTSQALIGHFKKAGTSPKRKVREFRDFASLAKINPSLGEEIKVETLFKEGDKIDIVGKSKGRGFQGVVKRHGFSGVGGATHGQHNRMRAPGSVGASSYPSRVLKGIRMGGRMGNTTVKIKNLRVLRIVPEHNILLVSGSIPGPNNSFVVVQK